MSGFLARKVVALLFIVSLFSCGELETLLPSNGSYQVKTMVNGNSLEECSVIRLNDKIRPYFAVSVEDDPDLIGLLMYLQNSRGELAGEKVRYILEAYADEQAQEQTEPKEETKLQETGNESPNESGEANKAEAAKTETTKTETTKTEATKTETEETEEAAETGVKESATAGVQETKGKRSSTNSKIKEKSPAIEIAVSSLADELPYFPLPTNTEPSSYTLVFEALGRNEVLSRTETTIFYLGSAEFNLKDVSVYLPMVSDSQLISPETTVLLETRLDFDSRLDPYVIWYNGKNIISEGKFTEGAGNILWKAPVLAGFYSLRLEVLPIQPRRNLAGFSREVTLPVSPRAVNPGYFFENTSNTATRSALAEGTPYIARSPLSEGTAYPEQLQLIESMLLEEDVTDDGDGEDETIAPVPPSPPELLRWYQFDGSLHDSTSPLAEEQSLVSVSKKDPRWASSGQSYGLSTEADDAYQLSAINFFLKEQDQGGGIFLFHIKPSTVESSAGGVIFNAFFPMLASEKDGAWIDMIRENNAIVLRLNAGGTTAEIPVYLDPFAGQGLIPIVVEFYILPSRLEAKITLGDNGQSNTGKVRLPGALKGEGKIRLGGENSVPTSATVKAPVKFKPPTESTGSSPVATSPVGVPPVGASSAGVSLVGVSVQDSPAKETDTDVIEENITQTVYHANTIWDEFAVLFSEVPLLEEEVFVAPIAEAEEIKNETKSENNTPEADQNDADQKVITSLTDDDTETVGGEEPASPELDTESTQERETVVILPEND